MTKSRIIIVVIVVIGLVALGVFMWKLFFGKRNQGGDVKPFGGDIHVLDGDGMINPYAIQSFTYQRGGGELGASYVLYLENDKLTVERCEGNGSKTVKKTYTVPSDVFENIMNILGAAGVRQFGNDLPRREEFALDAETTSVSVYYLDGASVSFDSDRKVPDGGWKAVNEVVELLENIADK